MRSFLIIISLSVVMLSYGCTTHEATKPTIAHDAGAVVKPPAYRTFNPNSPEDMAELRAMLAISPAEHKRADEQANHLYHGMKLEAVEKVTGPLRKKAEDSFALLGQLGLSPKDDFVCSVTTGLIDLYFIKSNNGEYLLDQWKVRPQKET